jgi:DNA-directed RNA polymerase beta' subunit
MENCYKKLKELIEEVVLPDIEDHIDSIFETIAKDKVTDDAKNTELQNMHELKDEFKTILEEIENKELDKDECEDIYKDIMDMISSKEE